MTTTAPLFSPRYVRRAHRALDIGLTTAPAYRGWRSFDPGSDVPVSRRYSALPKLTKSIMRESFPHGLVPNQRDVADGLARGEIEYVQTSGTTAEQVTNLWHQPWWNASEAASWKLNRSTAHLTHQQREAQLASALSVGVRSTSDLSMQERTMGRFLFLNEKVSATEWRDYHYERMLHELDEFAPVVLEANPSLLARLAMWTLDHARSIYIPDVVLLTYEYPSVLHWRAIEQAFSCPVVSSFGCTEAGYVLMQCEHGKLHQNTEYCHVDFAPTSRAHGAPRLGKLLVTTFHNPWVSLIRFDCGDFVYLDPTQSCACGRNEGYIVDSIGGRVANATLTTDGRVVTTKRLDDALGTVTSLRDYQLQQTDRHSYRLQIVTRDEENTTSQACEAVLRHIYGDDARVAIDVCDDIAPVASGKYRRTCTTFGLSEEVLFA